jgi:NitT/TauT family transport system substrate-binding protein
MILIKSFLVFLSFIFFNLQPLNAQTTTLRIGHFPNITHTQALVAHGLTRQGKGWFEQRLGKDVKIEWFIYNAGPSAVEAIFTNSVDLAYVGPNPAINGYVRSRGEDIRIIAGAANGGAALVVQPDLPLKTPADFKGRKIGTPQFGNTQDVAARAWLATGGLRITQAGGDAQVLPTSNPDQLSLFKTKQLDAVWTVEPWVSRLELEAGGKILVEEHDAITTVLITGTKTLSKNRAAITAFVKAHSELTEWIKNNPEEAQTIANNELEAETRSKMPPDLIKRAWARITLTDTVSISALEVFFKNAQSAGFLRGSANLSNLVEKP